MNLKEIKELINLMNENNLNELEIEREGGKIRIKKSPSGKFEAIAEERGAEGMIQTVRLDQDKVLKKPGAPEKNLVEIKAPMVGTFYRTASPDSKPYVEIGQTIEVGQIVCIVEAMKLMNEIKSEVRGKLVEVLVETADPVEYGQVLFMVEAV
ncbi:MAG: acetyl-CoA carboxylase biotin carboxyl carrier protein [Candidatus Omnitrophica bacterium]|nr:acetyl-CoA carboxylase biotin carboxyl carrier protein [Candidatus Omnitrophota bacterium]